ncbi:phenylalanine ammonia-lyase [Biscogniauxia mediterranea]|nr:phenylalanine ammonia-lyase [Biscogniauxia mediterranea]
MDTTRPHPHLEQTREIWRTLQQYLQRGNISVDGQKLDIAGVVAVSRYNCKPKIDKTPALVKGVEESVATLNQYLVDGSYVYGVNTGFGGSADVRTKDLFGLQVALIQHTQSAIIIGNDFGDGHHEELRHHSLPAPWVRGAMLVRANTNLRGHSAVSLPVAEAIVNLVSNDCTPFIPLRGTISASGDLMPLSYVAGSIMGNPDIKMQIGKGKDRRILPADQALRSLNMQPTILGPKEGLGLINGTAPSAAVATLALYDTHSLTVVSQVLTAMAAESLAANVEWAHPFIQDVRPHAGQVEVAQNIRSFLAGSKLVTSLGARAKDRFKVGIVQERYALRTSPQWLSPVLEDLLLAHRQIETELNSTTDNPIVNVGDNDVHSGGNFQAAAITSASEKMRLSLQMIGKMLFSQTSELINNNMNNGLPPNLAADDPSLSFCLKGIDVNMAAYQSELAFLANPVSSHVQSAEMHNQSMNSLALITTRYTMQAIELVSLMSAAALYTTCQAIDLRVMHMTFLEALRPLVEATVTEHLLVAKDSPLLDLLWKDIHSSWYESSHLDARQRAAHVASETVAVMATFAAENGTVTRASTPVSIKDVQSLRQSIAKTILQTYVKHRDAFFAHQPTEQYLGKATKQCYNFVRKTLGVPFHRGLVEQPQPGDTELDGRSKKTIGSWVSTIYEAVRDGRLIDHILGDHSEVAKLNGNGVGGYHEAYAG